ncbi:MAG: hypothetical protein N2115_06820 [bacterium]|nr:hypothetical protein [bacterium]
MYWKTLSKSLSIGQKIVEIRSLCIPDESGNFKRHRVTTCWDSSNPKFSKTPATGRLVKDKDGKIGVMINGKNGANIKVGRFDGSIPYIFVAINSISKKPRDMLLKTVQAELYSEGNFVFAREK